jgi:hypothetical protein
MNKRPLTLATLLACLALVPLLTACGKSSLTGPDTTTVASAPKTELDTNVRFDYVVVHADGDLIGPGEFEFIRGLDRARTFTAVDNLSDGDVWKINQSAGWAKGEGTTFSVYFQATEWDKDILGNNVPDPNMDHRSATKTYTVAPGLNGQYSITLGNSACKVQIYYTLTTRAYEVQP